MDTRLVPNDTASERSAASSRRGRLRVVVALVTAYLVVCAITMVVAFVLREDAAIVTDAVWVRGLIVLASAVTLLLFAVSASRGSKKSLLRLRIISAIVLVAIVVVVCIPGLLPLWMRLEQGLCGAILLAVVVLMNTRHARASE